AEPEERRADPEIEQDRFAVRLVDRRCIASQLRDARRGGDLGAAWNKDAEAVRPALPVRAQLLVREERCAFPRRDANGAQGGADRPFVDPAGWTGLAMVVFGDRAIHADAPGGGGPAQVPGDDRPGI